MLRQQLPTDILSTIRLSIMARVEMTQHLYRFFPQLKNQVITVPASSIAEVLQTIDDTAPGFIDYVLDEHGALRRHVNISINHSIVIDKVNLTDRVPDDATVYIFQALSGG